MLGGVGRGIARWKVVRKVGDEMCLVSKVTSPPARSILSSIYCRANQHFASQILERTPRAYVGVLPVFLRKVILLCFRGFWGCGTGGLIDWLVDFELGRVLGDE